MGYNVLVIVREKNRLYELFRYNKVEVSDLMSSAICFSKVPSNTAPAVTLSQKFRRQKSTQKIHIKITKNPPWFSLEGARCSRSTKKLFKLHTTSNYTQDTASRENSVEPCRPSQCKRKSTRALSSSSVKTTLRYASIVKLEMGNHRGNPPPQAPDHRRQ